MKRDLDLIKEILVFIENKNDTNPNPIQINGYNEDDINYNCTLLIDAGYIEAQVLGYGTVFPKRLTSKGHDFLDATKDAGLWKKAKEVVKEHGGGFTLEIIKSLLIDLIKKKLNLN